MGHGLADSPPASVARAPSAEPDGERLLSGREAGSAVVEFVFLAVLLMVPLFYLVMVMARLQAGAYAVSAAAREAGRAYTTAESPAQGPARAQAAADIAFGDQGFPGLGASQHRV